MGRAEGTRAIAPPSGTQGAHAQAGLGRQGDVRQPQHLRVGQREVLHVRPMSGRVPSSHSRARVAVGASTCRVARSGGTYGTTSCLPFETTRPAGFVGVSCSSTQHV